MLSLPGRPDSAVTSPARDTPRRQDVQERRDRTRLEAIAPRWVHRRGPAQRDVRHNVGKGFYGKAAELRLIASEHLSPAAKDEFWVQQLNGVQQWATHR